MNHRFMHSNIALVLAAAWLLASAADVRAGDESGRKPNILVILANDLGGRPRCSTVSVGNPLQIS